MKFIVPNNASVIAMTNEDSDFPAANMLTNYVKQKSKSTTYTSTVTFACNDADAIAIFGTNATNIKITIDYGIDIAWDSGISWDSGIAWEQSQDYETIGQYDPSDYDYRNDGNGKIWIDYDRDDPHFLSLEFSCPEGDILEIGVVYIGPTYLYNNPLLGIRYGVIDYSVIRELNSPGAMYINDGDQVSSYSFEFIEDYAVDFYEFLNSIVAANQMNPLPCWFIDDNYRHFAFCRINHNRMPRAMMGEMINHGRLNAEFIEVV